MKRLSPSRRRAQNASVALKIFVRHPKKTFATISTQRRLRPLARQVAAVMHGQQFQSFDFGP
jgi:hypothetical protein